MAEICITVYFTRRKQVSYFLKRISTSAVILFFVSVIIFTLIQLQPGNPFIGMISADTEPEYIEKRMEELGYNDPIPEQYIKWVKRVSTGDLGYSLQYKTKVSDLIVSRLKNTLLLSGTAFLLSTILSCVIGVYTAYKKNTIFDYVLMGLSFLLFSIPSFFVELLLIKVFSFDLGIFPPSGIITAGSHYQGWNYWKDIFLHMILPVGALTVIQTAAMMRYVRAYMNDVFHQDYMYVAKSKGLTRNRIIWVHGFRNILVSVITLFSMQLPTLISGAVLTETIFMWPGIGKLSYEAILAKDYPVVMGVTIFIAVIVLSMNLIADILGALFNPHIKWNR